MKYSDSVKIALQNIYQEKIFFITNVISISIAIFLLTIMLSVVFGIKTYVEKKLTKGASVLSIEVSNYDNTDISKVLNIKKITEFKNIEGVGNVFPKYLGIFGNLSLNDNEKIFISLESIYDQNEIDRNNLQIILGNATDFFSINKSIIIPYSIVNMLKIKDQKQIIGKTVYLEISRKIGKYEETLQFNLNVAGVAKQTMYDRCYIPFDLLHLISKWKNGIINSINESNYYYDIDIRTKYKNSSFPIVMLYAKDINSISSVQNYLEKMGYKPISIFSIIQQYRKINFIFILVIGFFSSISLVTGAIGIFNTSLASVIRRTKEIGIYKAIGASKSNILSIFINESIMTGIVGGTLSFIFSCLCIFAINILLSSYEDLPLLAIKWWIFLVADIISILTCMIATYFPALKASKLDPVESLMYE